MGRQDQLISHVDALSDCGYVSHLSMSVTAIRQHADYELKCAWCPPWCGTIT